MAACPVPAASRADARTTRVGRRRTYGAPTGIDAELVARHLDYMRLRGMAESTIYKRRRSLIRLAAWLSVPLMEATPELLGQWRAGLQLGTEATLTEITSARQFYQWAAEYSGLRSDNPARRLLRPRRSRRLPRPISEADLLHALAEAPPDLRPWLVLAAWAGLRAKEIALLRRENVLDQGRPAALLVAADATKGSAERIVPLSVFVLAELASCGLPASGWMFPRQDGKPGPNTPARLSQRANKHLHEHGVAATLHQLRHRFGTQAYRASKDLRAVQELMGHADPATTAGYAAYDVASAAEAVNALPVPAGCEISQLRAVRKAS